jgi:hypothetical protein
MIITFELSEDTKRRHSHTYASFENDTIVTRRVPAKTLYFTAFANYNSFQYDNQDGYRSFSSVYPMRCGFTAVS